MTEEQRGTSGEVDRGVDAIIRSRGLDPDAIDNAGRAVWRRDVQAVLAALSPSRDEVLEEAARVAEGYRYGDPLLDTCTIRAEQRQKIAATFRAMKEQG